MASAKKRDERDRAARRLRPARRSRESPGRIGAEVASTWPVMMTSDICSVNGIRSQKPRPQASTTCGGEDGVQVSAATTTTTVASEREDEGVGNPALGPGGQAQRGPGDEAWLLIRRRIRSVNR